MTGTALHSRSRRVTSTPSRSGRPRSSRITSGARVAASRRPVLAGRGLDQRGSRGAAASRAGSAAPAARRPPPAPAGACAASGSLDIGLRLSSFRRRAPRWAGEAEPHAAGPQFAAQIGRRARSRSRGRWRGPGRSPRGRRPSGGTSRTRAPRRPGEAGAVVRDLDLHGARAGPRRHADGRVRGRVLGRVLQQVDEQLLHEQRVDGTSGRSAGGRSRRAAPRRASTRASAAPTSSSSECHSRFSSTVAASSRVMSSRLVTRRFRRCASS